MGNIWKKLKKLNPLYWFTNWLNQPNEYEKQKIKELQFFEEDIANEFNAKRIKAPIHLDNGNELALIRLFNREIMPEDWILGSWRSHYISLLKGVPWQEVKRTILDRKSISLMFPKYRILSSGIVGGNIPIALGIALAIHKREGTEKVFCFVGDMTAETGGFHEALKYATNFDLPIIFVILDNNKSVCTNTRLSWGCKNLTYENSKHPKIRYIKYDSKYPHSGSLGKRINF